jgi:hypothetical protein
VDECHRSAPLVFKTETRWRELYVYKFATQDGSKEFVEMAVLELPDDNDPDKPWHLCEPVANREILFPRDSADAMWRAMAELV